MSYRQDLTGRLIQILFKLAHRPHSRQELAHEFAVDVKTISKDINALTREHPIESYRTGREVFYRFSDGYLYTVPALGPEELATMLLAQESIAGIGLTAQGSPYAAYADKLLQKVRDALPYTIRQRMDALSKVYGSAALPAKNFAPHIRTIDTLTSAALACRSVLLGYHSLNSNETSERLIDPYALYFDPDGATLKLIAYDHDHREIRAFSIDHIQNLRLTTKKFTRPKDFNLRAYLAANCFNGIHGAPITVRLRAHGVTARVFAERRFHPSQRTIKPLRHHPDHPDTITIELTVARGRGLIRFILSWLPDIEVLSPPSVRAEVAAALRQGLKSNAASPD